MYPADARGNCPASHALGLLGFRWPPKQHGPEPRDTELNAQRIASQLECVRALRFGHLYRCRVCDRLWYLNEETPLMERVPTPRRELLDRWDAEQLPPSDATLEVMHAIGATGSDLYGNGRGEWKVPCRIRWADGTISGPCVSIISKRPPLDDWRPRVALLTDAASLEPSEYALPREVRLASYNAPEIRMGFSPTHVKSSGGAPFILNGTHDVFSYGGLKGCDISLELSRSEYGPSMPMAGTPIETISFVYCHWFPGCEDLAIPGDWTPGRGWGHRAADSRDKSAGITGRLRGLANRLFRGGR